MNEDLNDDDDNIDTTTTTTTATSVNAIEVPSLSELISDADLQVAERVVRTLLENRDSAVTHKRFRELRFQTKTVRFEIFFYNTDM